MTAQCSACQPEANELQWEAEGAGQPGQHCLGLGCAASPNGREGPPRPPAHSCLAAAVVPAVWHSKDI